MTENTNSGPATESAEELAADDVADALPPRSILAPRPPATSAARRKLAEGLSALGLDESSATAIVRAVEDPEIVLRQLRYPAEFGVHGGSLLYVSCKLRMGGVIPIPTNPRVASRVRYDAGSGAGIEPLGIHGSDGDRATLILDAESRASLERDMLVVRDQVTSVNNLTDSVQSQGILLPITVLPVQFSFRDGSERAMVLASIDGSSRLTAAMGIWGLSSAAVLFDQSGSGPLHACSRTADELLGRDALALDDVDRGRLRTAVIPANLIVGVRFEGSPPYTLPQILDSYLGLIHVEPPTPWGEAASQDKRADAVLDELERLGRVTPETKKYLAGLMTPELAEAAGLDPTLDGHAARVFWEIDRRRNANAVNRALRRIGMREPDRTTRLEVATELAMRPYRRAVTDVQRRNPRLALPAAMARLRPDGDAWSPRIVSLDDLLSGALSELRGGAPGPACKELAVRGAFWLTRYSALQKSSRRDTRFADELLEQMWACEHGIRVLHRAIEDGRMGTVPRQVRADGSLLVTADSSNKSMDDSWLRQEFPPPAPPEEADGELEVPTPDNDPVLELRQRIYAVRDDAESLRQKVRSLDEVTVEGNPLVEDRGIPTDTAQEIKDSLQAVETRVTELEFMWRRTGGPAGD